MTTNKNNYKLETEKDIIYFCRNTLSHYNKYTKTTTREMYEEEVLNIIKGKDWDWTHTDIDGNTILTYPVYCNAYNIVEYLLQHNIYDISTYEKHISNSLCSCIMLTGKKMMNYILSYDNLHMDYKVDMAVKAGSMATYIESYRQTYLDKASIIFSKGIMFETMFKKIIKADIGGESLCYLLENHPLPFNEKQLIIDNESNLNNFTSNEIFAFKIKDKLNTIKKWQSFHYLQNELKNHENIDKKFKM